MDNCSINDKQIKILAEVFRLNKTITKLSLVNNKAILDIKLKPYQVTDNVESNKEQKKSYKEALEWLDKLTGSQAEHIVISINEIKANAHYYLGMIYENSKSELDWFRAIREYINALEIDRDFNFLYGHDIFVKK
ncbi:hypothetical protein MCC_01055 [Rickettsia rhipicephali str. 3-7-female6-CWPP]|uniref:Uncharacterized protein n=1 Tax=Rickettsia rhipicephali (strain 3-7-female6-CWPP) TaxID=1105113 RepID=A0AAI8A8Y9_RICR3|nr:hypothetical protein [Rickettsia rhipicephali]AFC71872.1 hypothetical protein MCC_01055 [Rickettsia rhipicephali str. 3-7-female6-CWPP]